MHGQRAHTALAASRPAWSTLGSATAAAQAARHPPPGYLILDTNQMDAPQGQQTQGSAQCPAGTVPLGGGVVVSSLSTLANPSVRESHQVRLVGQPSELAPRNSTPAAAPGRAARERNAWRWRAQRAQRGVSVSY
jgi:hypothetical protein